MINFAVEHGFSLMFLHGQNGGSPKPSFNNGLRPEALRLISEALTRINTLQGLHWASWFSLKDNGRLVCMRIGRTIFFVSGWYCVVSGMQPILLASSFTWLIVQHVKIEHQFLFYWLRGGALQILHMLWRGT